MILAATINLKVRDKKRRRMTKDHKIRVKKEMCVNISRYSKVKVIKTASFREFIYLSTLDWNS